MKKLITIYLIINFDLIFAGELTEKSISYLINYFSEEVTIETIKYNIPKELSHKIELKFQQKFFTEFVYLYLIKKNNEIIAYAILDNVLGKVQPITFLVIYDLDFNIKELEIIKYREEHGSEIKNEIWREQFVGKNSNTEIEMGKNVDAISGATISVKSIIKGVNKTSLLIKELISNAQN